MGQVVLTQDPGFQECLVCGYPCEGWADGEGEFLPKK